MRRLLPLVIAGGLLLGACGADAADGPGATSATTVVVPTSSGGVVPEALRFTAPTVGGGTLDMSTFAGSTVAYWFWAPT